MPTNYNDLLEFCKTARQTEVLKVLIKSSSQRAAAKELGVSRSTVQSVIETVKLNARRRLYSPEHGLSHPVPADFTGDFTIQRDAEGNVERSWMKGKGDKQQKHQQYLNFIEGLSTEIKPAKKTLKPKKQTTDQLASAIILGDAHLGMLAHSIETLDDDHNLETAIADIKAGINYCVDCALPSEQGWFINVGDFLHADTTKAQTHNETRVDMSARHNQVMRAAGMLIRYSIDKMLTKFHKVIVVNARGNHDQDAAFALNMYIDGIYEKEPRVEVRGNDAKFTFIEFGKCLIGINHGDGINASRLAGVMTRNMPEAWGRTNFRRWWVGHIHHKQKQEHDSGITIESFHTLAPLDNWHAASGYGAESRITMITLHKEHGQVNEIAPSLAMVREAYKPRKVA